MPTASFPVEVVNGVPVVKAPAEVDITSTAGLQTALRQAAARGNGTLVVDMSQTQFCDLAGLHVLVRAHQRAVAQGGEVRLVVGSAHVRRMLAITGIDGMIPSFPAMEQALPQMPAPARSDRMEGAQRG